MRRLTPVQIGLIIGGLVLAAILVLFLVGSGRENQDKLSDDQVAATRARSPAARCASQRTYDLIKRELFRNAAEARGSNQSAFDGLAAAASVRVDQPRLKSEDESIGLIRCAGRLSLDLPPGVAVVGGRRTLSADIDYVLQSAADNSGDVVMLEGADAITVPLATVTRVSTEQPLPDAEVTNDDLTTTEQESPQPEVGPPPPVAPAPAPPQPQAQPATASPSFNCRYARSRGEIAVCNDAGLAALDRDMAAAYFRAVSSANGPQRELLRTTRNRFLSYRDACRNDSCVADAYRGRVTEIHDIMAGTWNPPR